jgi:hypothetical protein
VSIFVDIINLNNFLARWSARFFAAAVHRLD